MEFKSDVDDDCGFHVARGAKAACSPAEVVDKLKQFAAVLFGKKQTDAATMRALKKKYKCDTEACILQIDDIRQFLGPQKVERVLKEYFKPAGPRATTAWLSNYDIDAVLEQIAKKYEHRHFRHIHYQMIDFASVGGELATMDWPAEYNKGYRTFGTVINTDKSSGNGIHWFAVFGDFSDDLDSYTVEYFNSSGDLPRDEITVWMNKMAALPFDKPINQIIATRLVNQRDTYSCGVYSLYYIISRLEGIPYQEFAHRRIGDENMHLFRMYIFRQDKPASRRC